MLAPYENMVGGRPDGTGERLRFPIRPNCRPEFPFHGRRSILLAAKKMKIYSETKPQAVSSRRGSARLFGKVDWRLG
jgi:hypothetical protein